MSKVSVDRELLERIVNTNMADYAVIAYQRKEIRFILEAQPAEAEWVSNARLMNTLAELARRAPLRTLHTICETQRQVSTVKLERYLEPVGDTLAGYAFTLRIDFNKLSSALAAVTAERDGLAAARMAYANEFAPDENGDPDVGNVHANIRALKAERDRLRDAAGKAIAWLDAEQNGSGVGINRRLKLCRDAENSLRAAMAAKEA